MSKQICCIPLSDVERLEIVVTGCRKSLAEVKEQTGADYILNGGMWNPDGSACPLLKADGKLLSKTPWSAYGYGWDKGPDIRMTTNYAACSHFIAVTPLILPGTGPVAKPSYGSAQGGRRGRSAIGLRGDALCLYCSSDGSGDAATPEQLRDELAGLGWTSATMLDGGGSSQCDFAGRTIRAGRKVHNWICVYLKKGGAEAPPDKEEKPVSRYTVCLDPGHGPGNGNGSPDGTYREWEFTWDMARRVKPLLEARGVGVVLTKTADNYPDLTQRANISNASHADCFVSLHTNAQSGGWGVARGLELYTSQGPMTAPRNVLASDLVNAFHTAGVILRSAPIQHSAYTVLVKTAAPACLIEYGFHTSREDVELLKDGAYRDKLAAATAKGVCDFLGVAWQDGKPVEPPDAWYAEAQQWVKHMGLADGTRPEDTCTRAEVWVMLQRLYEAVKAGK